MVWPSGLNGSGKTSAALPRVHAGNRSPSDRLAKVGWPEERRHAELLAKAATAEEALKAILEKPENAKVLADPAFRYAGVAQSGDCWVVLLGADE